MKHVTTLANFVATHFFQDTILIFLLKTLKIIQNHLKPFHHITFQGVLLENFDPDEAYFFLLLKSKAALPLTPTKNPIGAPINEIKKEIT